MTVTGTVTQAHELGNQRLDSESATLSSISPQHRGLAAVRSTDLRTVLRRSVFRVRQGGRARDADFSSYTLGLKKIPLFCPLG